MLPAKGLYGRSRNAAALSIILLASYLLLAVLCWALLRAVPHVFAALYVTVLNVSTEGMPPHGIDVLRRQVAATWHYPMLLVLLWWFMALLTHRWLVQLLTGATTVTRTDEPRLFNIVENTAIAVGLPMPSIDIVDTQDRNAYAVGLSLDASTVAVTRGLLETLDDRELQAVVAHEIAHIRNGDARVMLIATVFNGPVTLAADFIWQRVKTIARTPDLMTGGLVTLFFGGLLVLGVGSVFYAMGLIGLAIAASISQMREHMADADAVEITHDADALISALGKIAGHERIAWLNAGMSGFMFADPSPGRWLATHPALSDRVAAISRLRMKHPARPNMRGQAARTGAHARRPTVAFGRKA